MKAAVISPESADYRRGVAIFVTGFLHRGEPDKPALLRHTAEFAAAEIYGAVAEN